MIDLSYAVLALEVKINRAMCERASVKDATGAPWAGTTVRALDVAAIRSMVSGLRILRRLHDLPTSTVGERIRAQRMRRGMSMVHLAEHAGIDRSYVVHLEAGRRMASQPALERIAYVLCCRVEDLQGGTGAAGVR